MSEYRRVYIASEQAGKNVYTWLHGNEFIIDTSDMVQDFADLRGDRNMPLYEAIMNVIASRQRDEIVRCRDCKHLVAHGSGCEYWDYCDVESTDGFCAWGERKQDERDS